MKIRLSAVAAATLGLVACGSAWAETDSAARIGRVNSRPAVPLPPPGAVQPPYAAAPRVADRMHPVAACYAAPVSCPLQPAWTNAPRMTGAPCTCVGPWGVYWGQSG